MDETLAHRPLAVLEAFRLDLAGGEGENMEETGEGARGDTEKESNEHRKNIEGNGW